MKAQGPGAEGPRPGEAPRRTAEVEHEAHQARRAARRRGEAARRTRETDVQVKLALAPGKASIATGVPFFDHMLEQIARHGGIALTVKAKGDLQVDAHHTVEDVGIGLGEALRQAIGDKAGLARYGQAVVPLDEALVEAVVDLSGRPHLTFNAGLPSGKRFIGTFDVDLTQDFLQALRQPRPHLPARERALRAEPAPRGRGHLQGDRPRAARGPGARGDRAAVAPRGCCRYAWSRMRSA